jgi:hypothetical protein
VIYNSYVVEKHTKGSDKGIDREFVVSISHPMSKSVKYVSRKRGVIFFGWVFYLISLGSPHVLRAHMGHTRGGANVIDVAPAHVLFTAPFQAQVLRHRVRGPVGRVVRGVQRRHQGRVQGAPPRP